MKNALLALIAIGAGTLASDWLARLPVVHEVAGQVFQRGKLIALVGQRGVFEADLGARLREKQFCAGREDSDEAERVALREELIAGEALPTNAVTTNESERALVALRNQFADDRQFRVALQHSGVSQRNLRRALAEAIRGEGPAVAIRAPGAGEPRITQVLRRLVSTDALYLQIEGEEKAATLAKAIEDGPIEDMPIRAVLRQQAVPLQVYWAP